VRVINVGINVVELAGNVFQYADLDTVLTFNAKRGVLSRFGEINLELEFLAMASMSQQRTLITREELTEKCSSLLLGYRAQCAEATRATQVITPILVFLINLPLPVDYT
jgi:protein transport protein SEC24